MQNYELLKQIGKGSYGKVYTARNYEDRQLYVLKRIPFDNNQAEADAALREANVLSLLRHPHIVPYKEFFNHEGDLCLIMAHCEGGDLYHYIKQSRKNGQAIAESLAWQWMVQLLLSLSYCHSKKILHRDVKTQNVFMTADGRLMLGDFGLAKQLQRTMEMARTPIGTPYYMAPEIYEEEPYGFKSDVWALGCVMYEVLTGRPAFGADNLSRVVIKVLKGMYDPLPETYSPELRSLITSMLLKDVKKRPSANDLLQHPLVVTKVQAYLDSLSAAGSQAGWSTWRMKLPPTILTQMAQIIARSEQMQPGSAGGPGAARPASSRVTTAVPASRCKEDQLSSEELIKQFNLQSLMDHKGAGGKAGKPFDAGPQKHAQLLAAALHPDDGKKLKLAGAAQGAMMSELQLLKNQVAGVASRAPNRVAVLTAQDRERGCGTDDDQYSDDFEDGDAVSREPSYADCGWDRHVAEGPAAQLLGTTRGPDGKGRLGGTGLREPGCISLRNRAKAGDASLDEALLSEGLPKAGFGFGGGGFGAAPARKVQKVSTPDTISDPKLASPGIARKLAPLISGAYSGPGNLPQVPALIKPASFAFAMPSADGLGLGSPATPRGGWKAPGALKDVLNGAPHDPSRSGQIRLHEVLTTRATFLRSELTLQLGGSEQLRAACNAVLVLHRAIRKACGGKGSEEEHPSDGALREALAGVVSPAHLELAPLLDELVLLQERFLAA